MASPSRQNKPHQPGTNNKTELYPNSASRGGGRKEKRLERSTLKETREEAAAVVGGGDIETRGSSMVDLELSDSLSTGEFPSDVTFRYVYVCVEVYVRVYMYVCRGESEVKMCMGRHIYHN